MVVLAVMLVVMVVVMVVVLVEAMVLMGVVAKLVRQVKSPILYLMSLIIVVRQNPTALVKKSIIMLDF